MPLKTPKFWTQRGTLSALLLPAAAVYGALAARRARAVQPQTLPVPVICIGNAVTGGAGKTPLALVVGEWCVKREMQVAFVTRGYGGSALGPLQVDLARHTSAEAGDEALLLARVAPTFVGKDRLAAAKAAIAAGAKLLVLDDGFQNHTITKNLSLLAVDGEYGFGNGRLLPAGPLREPATAALARTDAVVVIGGDFALDTEKPVLRAQLTPQSSAHALRGQRVLGFAGLGRPEKFCATLEKLGCIVTAFYGFADHHPYRTEELEALHARARELQATLVTTEKDAVRLSPLWRGKVTPMPVRLEFAGTSALETLLEPLCD